MKHLIVKVLVNGIALMATAALIDGIYADSFVAVLLAAIVLGIINASIRPIFMVLTLPVNVLSLGLFTFVINGFMLKLTSMVVAGFEVSGFWAATLGALVLSVISTVLNWLITD